ncbi:MAG: S8 family serine peptidase, partial [bacterium]
MRTFRIFLSICSIVGIFSSTATGEDNPKTSLTREARRPKYRRGEVVVKLRTPLGATRADGAAARTGIPSVDELLTRFEVSSVEKRFKHRPIPPGSALPDLSRIYRITFPGGYEPLQVARTLAANPWVEYAEPIYIDAIAEVPNDPRFDDQYHLTQIRAPEAWDYQHGDSTVVIAVVDNGTDWDHPDLYANIWTNEAEANGIEGVDDDDNGYIDDIHGYDLAEDDNDPTNPPRDAGGYYSHGTHTAGLAAAVTNNGTGVASISWNCEIMPIKASYDDDPQYVDMGYEGIVYAAENGADIISLSWGSFRNYSQADQDVINYAYGLGSIVVGAAGNEARSDPHYPSSYINALSVSWVNSQDRKATTAAWGIAVDVCAPGVSILSTVPVVGGSYGRISGSSMACPIVAGLCGLIKARHPDWSNDRIVRQVVLTADNIDGLNPLFGGQLGSGRINAYRAVTEADLTEVLPRLALFAVVSHDTANGDGDGLFERGEEIDLSVTLRNYALSPATDVIVTISTADPDLTVSHGTSVVPHIPADTLAATVDPVTFSVAPDAQAHMAKLIVDFTSAEGASGSDSVSVIIGKMPILLVDDDDGENDVEAYYTTLFDKLGLQYAHWDHLTLGPPTGSTMSVFPIVVWLCEWAFPSLDANDRAAISSYLDGGGNLFISGQDIGWDLADPTADGIGEYSEETVVFYNNYLHAIYYADDSPVHAVLGTEGDAIGDGLSFSIWQPGRPTEYQFPDEIEPAPGA